MVFREDLSSLLPAELSLQVGRGLSLPIHGHLEFKGPDGKLSLEPVLLHPVLLFCQERETPLRRFPGAFCHCFSTTSLMPACTKREQGCLAHPWVSLLWHFSSQHPLLLCQLPVPWARVSGEADALRCRRAQQEKGGTRRDHEQLDTSQG